MDEPQEGKWVPRRRKDRYREGKGGRIDVLIYFSRVLLLNSSQNGVSSPPSARRSAKAITVKFLGARKVLELADHRSEPLPGIRRTTRREVPP